MKLSKQDLMRLPKERLAELLVEMQEAPTITTPEPTPIPFPYPATPWPYTPWWGADHPITITDSPNTATGTSTLKAEGKQ